MTASNHAVFGATIAAIYPHPTVAIPAALISHFILDSLPHFNMPQKNQKLFNKILISDAFIAAAFMTTILILRPHFWWLYIVCALFAMSPDLMWLPGYLRIFKDNKSNNIKPNLVLKFHSKLNWGEKTWGMLIELPWFCTMIFAFFVLAR